MSKHPMPHMENTPSSSMPPIILASTSPRRRELLGSLGVPFEILAPTVDEESFEVAHLSPAEQVLFLAREKALSIAKVNPEALVIGSDTLVAIDGQVLGKPKSRQEAFEMLSRLQGNVHIVCSAITVALGDRVESDVLSTQVWMKAMTPEMIERYINTGEPMDKAGAYAIQGYGSLNIEKIDGCYFNVVGMSLFLLNQIMNRFGVELLTVES